MVKPSCLITGDDALLCALDRLSCRGRGCEVFSVEAAASVAKGAK